LQQAANNKKDKITVENWRK